MSNQADETSSYEQALRENKFVSYFLRLYITGTTPHSLRAVANIKNICETHLPNRYSLEVIDIYQQPSLAQADQIIAVPTLVKKLPAPLKRLIGDMSNTEHVLQELDIRPKDETH